MTVDDCALRDLRDRLVAIQAASEALEADFERVKTELEHLQGTVKRDHHDHQNVRQMVLSALDELDRLVPRGPP